MKIRSENFTLFLFYAAFVLIGNPLLYFFGVGFCNSLCNGVLLNCGSNHSFEPPIRVAALWIACFPPLLIWPVAGAVLGADLFHWRFLQPAKEKLLP